VTMKEIVYFSLIFSLIIGSCTQKEARSPIEGTWQLVNGRYLSSDTSINYPGNFNGNHWKILTDSHFATIYQDTASNKFLSTGFNGGTYTYIDGIYKEYYTHSSISNSQIGMELTFKAKVEDDKLFISPCSEDGKEEEFGNFEEYKRLD
jgi:hypothetical protein